jgi:long-chain acyl-CoA synthetase
MNNELLSPASFVKKWALEYPKKIFLKQPTGEHYKETNWKEAYTLVSKLANYLSRYPTNTKIAIFSGNCDDWFLIDMAIMAAGHISIPIYPTANEKTVLQILQHSEAKVVFIGNNQTEFNLEIFDYCDEKLAMQSKNSPFSFWKDLIDEQSLLDVFFKPNNKDIATIIYTSGTTGTPKGVVISYRAISAGLASVDKSVNFGKNERFLSYLPLAHIMERMAVEMSSIRSCAEVTFVENLSTFSKNLYDTQPTVFLSVPRIWVKIKQGIEAKFGGSKRFKQIMNIPIVGYFLGKRIIKKLGLAEARYAIVGAAAISKDTLNWYEKLGLPILEGYGLSETLGISNINLPELRRVGSVGKNMPDCEMKISSTGEILLRSKIAMDGYYKNPELTAEVVKDGWFHTGDLGVVDKNGFLSLKGRVKELFKTSKGKYISPIPIELRIEKYLATDQVCVFGSLLSQPVAVVVMNLQSEQDLDTFKQKASRKLEKINQKLESHEKVECIIISQTEWTPANEKMTPTLKIKRTEIENHFQPIYQKLNEPCDVLIVD